MLWARREYLIQNKMFIWREKEGNSTKIPYAIVTLQHAAWKIIKKLLKNGPENRLFFYSISVSDKFD